MVKTNQLCSRKVRFNSKKTMVGNKFYKKGSFKIWQLK